MNEFCNFGSVFDVLSNAYVVSGDNVITYT